uniref:AMP-activated protein kinase glycogen-binding domain-containing protein n=1 Tax=Davidia involucrata TaxID=16924 RepID=A0A5B6YIA4_DAVIN
MVSLITSQSHLTVSPLFFVDMNFPVVSPLVVVLNPRRRRRQAVGCFRLVAVKETGSLGFVDSKRRHYESSWCCWCKGWESEGDLALEAEILEFMKKSEKPEVFPTKKELVDAERMDLVEAIVKKGGWLSLGWDLDDENEEEKVQENGITVRDCDNGVLAGGYIGEFQRIVEQNYQEIKSLEGPEVGSSGLSSVSTDSSQSASSTGRSLEMGAEEDTGIQGILSRLEKQRNLSFGINLGKNGYSTNTSKNGEDDLEEFETSTDADSADLERSSRLTSGRADNNINNSSGGKISRDRTVSEFDALRNSFKPEMWRTWSIQRAGFSDTEFEAAEISFNKNMSEEKDASKDETLAITEGAIKPLDRQKQINHNQIRARLQRMELELSFALRLLRSKSVVSKEGHESLSNDLRKLSDAWEFQENEFMNAKDRLRSIRAKLAVLEGKMALAIIDAQKIVEEKQKRIDGAHGAKKLLRTTRVVWPNSASEVLLTGSFDGWTTQV